MEQEQCAAIVAGNYGWVNGVYYDDLADAVRPRWQRRDRADHHREVVRSHSKQ